jgi:3-(3-hydroxy-phenyl)propionate hydroxylase
MTEHEVVIAGGGPTGLMLAGELALAGRQAASYRAGRVLLAGDAAHVTTRWADRASTSVWRMR